VHTILALVSEVTHPIAVVQIIRQAIQHLQEGKPLLTEGIILMPMHSSQRTFGELQIQVVLVFNEKGVSNCAYIFTTTLNLEQPLG
jgi:hypothetical protein